MVRHEFNSEYLNDSEKSFSKEYLLTNGAGLYSSSSIAGCHIRKYHGLFVVPQPQIDDNDHVLLSSLDEQVSYKDENYHLGVHKYPNSIYPQGFKYIKDFSANPNPVWIYHLGDCVLSKEILLSENENTLLIKYVIEEASEGLEMELTPFLAFRSVHSLKQACLTAKRTAQEVQNGIEVKLYTGYEHVYIQTSHKSSFVANPDWYYNIEYPMEQARGYNYTEDLFVPGQLNLSLKKGDKLVVSVGLKECNPKSLATKFTTLRKKQEVLNSEFDCLNYAARQFIIKQDSEVRIKAGYHWFGSWGRDTFISMPGLLLTSGNTKEFKEVINSSLSDLKKGLLPNIGKGKNSVYNSVDSSLWFIWAIQQYAIYTNAPSKIWKEYCEYLSQILEYYENGTLYNIIMDEDGLITAGSEKVALTWMDAIVDGTPVTPRWGKAVEINALWYNAVCFCVEAARAAKDEDFVSKWKDLPKLIKTSFMDVFWSKDKSYLADVVNNDGTDWSIRPNQIFALSLPYSPVADFAKRTILNVVKEELFTPRGLRTLSRRDENYQPVCEGNQNSRDSAYHQGTIWPWLLGHFAEAYIKEYESDGLQLAEGIWNDCKDMLEGDCLFTVPEIYNGDYPHKPVGAVAQAWSVAEMLRINELIKQYSKREKVYQSEKI